MTNSAVFADAALAGRCWFLFVTPQQRDVATTDAHVAAVYQMREAVNGQTDSARFRAIFVVELQRNPRWQGMKKAAFAGRLFRAS